MMVEAPTIGIAIDRYWSNLCEAFHQPGGLPRWASGLRGAGLHCHDDWVGEGPEGPIRVRLSSRNDHGVLDHWVTPEGGAEISIPLRVLANGDGAEVILTLFRLPGMDDATFARDAEWVRKDLATLKRGAEGHT